MLKPHFDDHVKSTLIFGRLPLLKTPCGTELVQSKAIVRFIAKLCGLAGSSDDEIARCDMLDEMLRTEAQIDGHAVPKLTPEIVSGAGPQDMKKISRREMIELDDTQKLVTALKFWDAQTQRSSTGWMQGGLGDEGPADLCYVDLSIYWTLRAHLVVLETCGFTNLVAFVKKASALPGVTRLFDSGRLMPNMDGDYNYIGDDLVATPAS